MLILSLITGFSSQAQDLITEACYEGLKIRQIPGSESILTKYFDRFIGADTIYAIIFPPANCPRCEAMINPIISNLKKIRPHTPTVLISDYPDSIAAKKYIKRYSLSADYFIFDTDSKYKSIFSFDFGCLHIPYLLKINPSSGNLILGVRAEDNRPAFLNEFCMFDSTIEKKEFELSKNHIGLFNPSGKALTVKHQYTLSYPDTLSLSEIIYQPEFYKDKLFFNDKLRESIVCFETTGQDSSEMEYKQEFKTNRSQNKQFVKIPDSIYYSLAKTNDVRFIPLSPKMIDEHTLAISYSLPRLWYTGTNSIGYMNQASILLVDTESTKPGELIPIIKNNEEDFFYPHFSLFKYGTDFAIGCERMTWPMEFEKEEYCNDPEFNPFSDDFYSFPQPIAASFDKKTGRLKERIGNLPELSKFTKTGYYFVTPVIDSREQEIAISDGFTGRITIIKEDNSAIYKDYTAFDIPSELIPRPDDSAFYSYDCVDPYISVFNRNIVDVKLTEDNIYLLIRYGLHAKEDLETDEYSVIKIDRECGCKTENKFNINNNELKCYGLRRTENGIEPYAICKTNNTWMVFTYDF